MIHLSSLAKDVVAINAMYRWQVDELMRKGCEEQGHVMENCCSVVFRIYQKCKYCGLEG